MPSGYWGYVESCCHCKDSPWNQGERGHGKGTCNTLSALTSDDRKTHHDFIYS